jgi:hypothetical protein
MLKKQTKLKFLALAIISVAMMGSALPCKAQTTYYENFFNTYAYWNGYYNATGNTFYYYLYNAYYYYYYGSLTGDYYGYYYDTDGFRSQQYKGSEPYWDSFYDYYSYYGDLYYHAAVGGPKAAPAKAAPAIPALPPTQPVKG